MERVITANTDKYHYRADACVVWCFDDRFSGLLQKFVEGEEFKHIDLIKVAGGAKGLASPSSEAEREYLLDQIAKSVKLHHPPLIVLMVHADCGAYGKKFISTEDEQNFYLSEVEKAADEVRKFLKSSGAETTVQKYIANFDGLIRA